MAAPTPPRAFIRSLATPAGFLTVPPARIRWLHNTNGNGNTANGYSALYFNTAGIDNTATGVDALYFNTTGISNTAIGVGALFFSTTGSNNTALGLGAGNNVTTADNVIAIGAGVFGENVSDTCYIGNIFGVTSAGGTAVYVNSDGKLWHGYLFPAVQRRN